MANYVWPQFCIQEDWQEVLQRSEEKVWVSVRRIDQSGGHNTMRGHLQQNHSKLQHQSHSDFTIKSISSNQLSICCPDDLECLFISPVQALKLHYNKPILTGDISSSGGLGVCGSHDGHMWIWDTSTGETRRTLSGHVADIETCKFFPSGLVVLSGGGDFMLKIWSVTDGGCARTLKGHTRRITSTAIIDKGKNFISTSADGTARLWDCGRGQCIRTVGTASCVINDSSIIGSTSLPNHSQYSDEGECATSQKMLVIACEDGSLQIYDIFNQKMVNEYRSTSEVTACLFINETLIIAGCLNGSVLCYNIRANNVMWSVRGLSSSSVTALNRVNQQTIAIGFGDGTCVVINNIHESEPSAQCVLTGPCIDPVTAISVINNTIYTGCRDGVVRNYLI